MEYSLHKFQIRAFKSKKPIIITSSGIQGGKTTNGALWFGNKAMGIKAGTPEEKKIAKESNLILGAPDYKTLQQASLPKFLEIYGQFGEYLKGDSVFKFHHGPTVYIRTFVKNPNAAEGITNVIAIWVDEIGLLTRYGWENLMGRAAFKSAQIMGTTTPYALNWLFEMWEDWKAGKRDDVDFINFRSIDNPYFPRSEYERQKRLLDPRRFAMKYDGIFGQMEGLVYEQINYIQAKPLPAGTRYFAGVDWGYTDPFALTILANTPQKEIIRVGEFYKSGLTITDIIDICKQRKQLYNIELFICDPSRPDSIEALNRAGLKAIGGNNNIRQGIDEVTRLIRENRFMIFKDENPYGVDEYNVYHYPEKKDLKIDEASKDQLPVDANNHSIDADRYGIMYIESNIPRIISPHSPEDNIRPNSNLERLKWLKAGGSSRNI